VFSNEGVAQETQKIASYGGMEQDVF